MVFQKKSTYPFNKSVNFVKYMINNIDVMLCIIKMKRRSYNHFLVFVVFVMTFIYVVRVINFKNDRKSFKRSIEEEHHYCSIDNYFVNHKNEFKNLDMEIGAEDKSPQYKLIKEHVKDIGGYYVDIGSNRGDFTQSLLHFDPVAAVDTYDVIEKFVDRVRDRFNKYNVNAKHLAMTDGKSPDIIEIKGKASWKNDKTFFTGASSLVRNKEHNTVIASVKTSSIDNEYFKTNVNIDFLKIDTEGNDARVLHGAYHMLKSKRIGFIFFENNKMQLEIGDNLFKSIQFMNQFDYQCYLFGSKRSIHLNSLCENNYIFSSLMTLNIYCEP